MSLDAAVTAVRTRAETLWPGVEPSVTLAFEDDDFQAPQPPAPWVMIEVIWGGGGEFLSVGSPGSNLARRPGHIWAHGFIPQGTGTVRAHQIASEAASMFEGADFGGLVCQAMQPGGPAGSENGNYFGQSVSIPFNFDESA